MLQTLSSRKQPSSVGPTTSWSPSRQIPLQSRAQEAQRRSKPPTYFSTRSFPSESLGLGGETPNCDLKLREMTILPQSRLKAHTSRAWQTGTCWLNTEHLIPERAIMPLGRVSGDLVSLVATKSAECTLGVFVGSRPTLPPAGAERS